MTMEKLCDKGVAFLFVRNNKQLYPELQDDILKLKKKKHMKIIIIMYNLDHHALAEHYLGEVGDATWKMFEKLSDGNIFRPEWFYRNDTLSQFDKIVKIAMDNFVPHVSEL